MDHALTKQRLAEADEVVSSGRRHIKRQREIVAELGQDGHDATLARELLATFELLQREHEGHRDRLRAELGTEQGALLVPSKSCVHDK